MAGFEDGGVVLERPLWACIGAVPEILRVIILGLAQYTNAMNPFWSPYEYWVCGSHSLRSVPFSVW